MAAPAAATPTFTKGQVNRAGKLLLEGSERMGRGDSEEAMLDELGADRLEGAWEALRWWRSLHARPLSMVAANLRYHVDRADGRVQGRIEVAQRLKRMNTLVGKLARETGNVTQMHDIGGVRAVLPNLRAVYAVRRRLLKSWSPLLRERDYIEKPKHDGYRAVHLIFRRRGYAIEVQLRTNGQDVWANQVEQLGRQAGVGLKFGEGSADLLDKLREAAEVIARFERSEISAEELREGLLPVE